MKWENEIRNDRQDHYGHAKDRLDWISKYLELADKIIKTHMPDGPKQVNEH